MRELVRSLGQVAMRAHQTEIELALHFAMDYAQNSEWRLGLEILCDNLYEYSFPLPRTLYEEIAALGKSWEISPLRIEMLNELIHDDSRSSACDRSRN